MDDRPIGVFDSGVGGLSILRQMRTLLPYEDMLFFADQAHVPYGSRTLAQVHQFAQGITQFLIQQDAKLIVVACNTASAAALHQLRVTFPTIPFVGMEPAVKPAAETTRSRVVGVLATPATFQGELFASVVERFASDVTVIRQTLPNLVAHIEAGDLDGPETRGILHTQLRPLLDAGVDTLVLACTHYPLIIPALNDIVGPDVNVIDPSPAIARQAKRLLDQHDLNSSSGRASRVTYYSSGEPQALAEMAMWLIKEPGEALQAVWKDDRLIEQ
jgi:glutamate racemase